MARQQGAVGLSTVCQTRTTSPRFAVPPDSGPLGSTVALVVHVEQGSGETRVRDQAMNMPMFLISSVPQEGLYIAHLSAAATVASVPVILVGWIARRSPVRGLSMGAIK